jgi:Pyridoxamine 5'-phosphate oxidase
MQPTATQLPLPRPYGTPSRVLAWDAVEGKLASAERYWLATTCPDGRPHVVPVDGLWVDGAWYFGGHPSTVYQRNLRHSREVVVHLEDANAAVIAEGTVELVQAPADLARRLSDASKEKYGYGQPASTYQSGVWRLRPRRVLAWDNLPEDATRFTF